tara:strand:+ start:3496 stop:4491 length:996 start_codon:yes stop_codon:yes gene_type:complete
MLLSTYLFSIIIMLSSASSTLAEVSCPARPTVQLKDQGLEAVGIIKPNGIVAAQGILSYSDKSENKIALTTGYWDNNATILSGDAFDDIKHKNLSTKTPSGMIASVFKQNGNLWWTSYREKVVFVTDLSGENSTSISTPNLIGPVGLTGDPETGLILIPSRDKEKKIYIFDEKNPTRQFVLKLKGMNSAPYDIDFYKGCLFLVESNEAKIWTLEMDDILENIREIQENEDSFFGNLFTSYDLKPQIWFSKLNRPQHQFIHKEMLYVMDTGDFSVIKIGLEKGSFQKLTLPIQHIFRGLTVTSEGEIMLTGFQDTEEIKESRTAIFRMSEVN